MQFEFYEQGGMDSIAADFVMKIPGGLSSKNALLEAVARVGNFPSHFGMNWDALLDCLVDFTWIEQKCIVMIHEDIPLIGNPAECRVYLDVLSAAINDWMSQKERPLPGCRLRVFFPRHLGSQLSAILKL